MYPKKYVPKNLSKKDKTKDIKDVAARERAVVAEIQKEHNRLKTSSLENEIV